MLCPASEGCRLFCNASIVGAQTRPRQSPAAVTAIPPIPDSNAAFRAINCLTHRSNMHKKKDRQLRRSFGFRDLGGRSGWKHDGHLLLSATSKKTYQAQASAEKW